MYGGDIKRFPVGMVEKKVNHCLRNEVKQINVEEKRRGEKGRRGGDNTIMMKAVGFHFILSSHVIMNLENDIREQFENEQFVCAQTGLARCEGKPCPYTFILSDERSVQIPPPYLQHRGGFVSTPTVSWVLLCCYNMQSSLLINNQMANKTCTGNRRR